ncbi:MAG: ABC transporter permease [Candidatus Thorarchaeota archaeon]
MKYENYLYSGLAILLAVFLGGLLSLMVGFDVLLVYRYLIQGSIGTLWGFFNTADRWVVFVLIGLSMVIPFKMRIWTLGAEGQIYMGALAATYIFTLYPSYANIIVCSMAAILLGGLWGIIAGILKIKFDADEIVTTLFMNYIAIFITGYFVGPEGSLRDTSQAGNQSLPIPYNLDLLTGALIVLILAFLLYFLMTRTTIGYEIRALGSNPQAAEYAGMKRNRLVMLAMAISGMIAGLSGVFLMTNITRILVIDFSPGYGYIGIGITMLADIHAIAVLPFAFFFSMLYSGGEYLNIRTGLPITFINTIMAMVIIFSLLKNNFRHAVAWSRRIYRDRQQVLTRIKQAISRSMDAIRQFPRSKEVAE